MITPKFKGINMGDLHLCGEKKNSLKLFYITLSNVGEKYKNDLVTIN